MILTRLLAKTLQAVLRRALDLRGRRSSLQPVRVITGPDGLIVQACAQYHAVEYRQPGQLTAESATWQEKGVPQNLTLDVPGNGKPPEFPMLPENLSASDPRFVAAFCDAAQLTDPESCRYALGCVKLRGKAGAIDATDGLHALRQTGFNFPFESDLIVPPMPALAMKELAGITDPPLWGCTDTHLVVRLGGWTFFSEIQTKARFPWLDEIIKDRASATTFVELSADDREFLLSKLPLLPAVDDFHPVTVDLNGQVVFRAKGEAGEAATELVLSNSQKDGSDVCIPVNRKYLERAMRLGLSRLRASDDRSVLVASDDTRDYAWMPLDASYIVPAGKNVNRVLSPAPSPTAKSPVSIPLTEKTMPKRKTKPAQPEPVEAPPASAADPHPVTTMPAASGEPPTVGPIDQAVRLHDALRDALSATSELVRALKRQKQQHKLVQTTLASLRQLEEVA